MKSITKLLLTVFTVSILTSSLFAIGPTPEVKEQMIRHGKWQNYLQNRKALYRRGIDQPAKHPPNLKKIRQRQGLFKATSPTYLNALVILVDFSDNPADTVDNTPAKFEDLLFSEGTYPTGSMNDWYLENSYDQVGITGQITRWVRLPHPYSYYVDNQNGFGDYPRNAQGMAEDAVAAVDSFVDFSQFDNDNNGEVDALFIVHAGPGAEATGNDSDIWSHSWSFGTQYRDGVALSGYTTEPEWQGNPADSNFVTMGVFGHEFGHALGLPDLYDTDYTSDGVGDWSMMSGGSWGNNGRTPVHFDAWSKYFLGWLDPVVLRSDTTNVVFNPVEYQPQVMRLWTAGSQGPEYYLVENRQKTGFDSYLPGEGLLIWHIDERINSNTNEYHKEVALVQADGRMDLEHNRGSDGGDPYPGLYMNTEFSGSSTPNSNDYEDNPTQVSVTNIATQGEDMSFDAAVEYQEPFLAFDQWAVLDNHGNGILDSGETDTLVVRLRNLGQPYENVFARLSTDVSGITIQNDSVYVGSIESNSPVNLDTVFIVSVDSSVAPWTLANFTIGLSNDAGIRFQYNLTAYINQGYGYHTTFESDAALWNNYAVTEHFLKGWNITTIDNHSPLGTKSWKVGDPEGGYMNSMDAALESPRIFLDDTTDYTLTFWDKIDAEIDNNTTNAWDGGRVEISTDDGLSWAPLTPSGGYPYSIINNPASPFDPGTPVFSGTYDWQLETVPLDGYSGEILIRFRFGSDGLTTRDGWYIDDLTIEGSTQPLAIQNQGRELPQGTLLLQNYPNPFNPVTTIPFELAGREAITISVYNLGGQLVKTLLHDIRDAGHYKIQWDARDATGKQVSSGMYFIRLQTSKQTFVRKLTLLR